MHCSFREAAVVRCRFIWSVWSCRWQNALGPKTSHASLSRRLRWSRINWQWGAAPSCRAWCTAMMWCRGPAWRASSGCGRRCWRPGGKTACNPRSAVICSETTNQYTDHQLIVLAILFVQLADCMQSEVCCALSRDFHPMRRWLVDCDVASSVRGLHAIQGLLCSVQRSPPNAKMTSLL